MSRRRAARIRRPSLEGLEPRALPSAVVSDPAEIWPTNVIPYVIDPTMPNPGRVVQAVDEYNTQTTVQWVPRTDQSAYVDFVRAPWTGVDVATEGYPGAGAFDAAYITDDAPVGVILHEMGHTLGLLHEQERNDRDSYIIVNYQNIVAGAASQFDEFGSDGKDVGPFDYQSIMIYGGYDFSSNGQPTITYPDGTPIAVTTKLSQGDIRSLDTLYPAAAGQAKVPGDVAASADLTGRIQVTWTDTNAGQATYTVKRAAAGGTFQAIATLPAGSTSYVDDQVSGGTVYEYMIVAATTTDVPAVSPIVYGATAAAAPTGLTASVSNGIVTLSWTDPTGGAASFNVEVSMNGGDFLSIGTPAQGVTSFTVDSIWSQDPSQIQYTYRVQAEIGLGLDSSRPALWVSDDSNAVSFGEEGGIGTGGTGGTGSTGGAGGTGSTGGTGGTGSTTGGTGGGAQPIVPQVLGVVEVQETKGRIRSVTIAFNEAMNPGSVGNSALYSVLEGVRRGRKVVFKKKVELGAIAYDEAAHTVLISLSRPYKGPVQVSVDRIIESLDDATGTSSFAEVVR